MWYWFGLAALALIGETFSGTFYLLLVALAFVAAGLGAAFGLTFPLQLFVCAVIVVVGVLVLRRVGVLKTRSDSSTNADVNLDIGQMVNVPAWDPDGTARVWYRGAHWQAEVTHGGARRPGAYRIVGVRGSLLVLSPIE